MSSNSRGRLPGGMMIAKDDVNIELTAMSPVSANATLTEKAELAFNNTKKHLRWDGGKTLFMSGYEQGRQDGLLTGIADGFKFGYNQAMIYARQGFAGPPKIMEGDEIVMTAEVVKAKPTDGHAPRSLEQEVVETRSSIAVLEEKAIVSVKFVGAEWPGAGSKEAHKVKEKGGSIIDHTGQSSIASAGNGRNGGVKICPGSGTPHRKNDPVESLLDFSAEDPFSYRNPPFPIPPSR
ncbi:hypothetical protein VTK26DRAFT_3716 [Humicola hyalothermophila]